MPIPARRVALLNLGQSRLLRRLLPLAFLLAAIPGNAVASNITVTTNSDPVALTPGSLRYAIATANSDDTITFAVIGTITLKQGALAISQNLTITGNGGVVIDGNFASQIFNINTGTVSISSLILQGGQNTGMIGGGGAIYNNGSLTITSCTIVSNGDPTNGAGGAIFNDSTGSLTIANSTFSGNAALATMFGGGEGGAIYDQGVSLSISNSTFTNNQVTDPGGIRAAMGGAIYTAGTATITGSTFSGNIMAGISVLDYGGGAIAVGTSGTLTLSNSTISGNLSNGAGGGGLVNLGTVTITASTFSGNSAPGNSFSGGEGGAILNLSMSYTLTVVDSTISGNSVADSGNAGGALGGGIFNFGGTLSVQNSTISGNSQTGGGSNLGGGIVNNGGSGGTVTLTNTILAGNTDSGAGFPDGFGPFDPTSAANLIGNGTGTSGISNGSNRNQVGTSTSPINPGLNPLGNYGGPTQTMWPSPNSPAIAAGSTASTAVATDQRGLPRTVNGNVDIGAVEFQGVTVSSSAGSGQSAQVGTAFTNSLTATWVETSTLLPLAGAVVNYSAPLSGASATLHTSPTTTASNGASSISATANTIAGSYTVTASLNGVTANFSLTNNPGPATTFSVSGPGAVAAGTAFSVTVTALDQYGNIATGYRGTVGFTSTDTNASVILPANYTFISGDNGAHTFTNAVKLVTGGSQTVTATDTVSSSIKGTTGVIVSAGVTTQLSVSAPVSATAGTAFSVTVTAQDQYGNTTSNYHGTVSFTSTDTNASVVLPANYTFTSGGDFGGDFGVHTFTSAVKLITSGNQTVTATDTASSSIKGTSNGIAVSAGAATLLSVSAPGSATAGTAFSVTVTALDQYNNTAASYRGAVKFTSTDTNASVVLPTNYAFSSGDNGVHVFTGGVTLVGPGSQTVTATDTVTSSIKGTSSGIAVSAGAATLLSVSAPGSATAGAPFSVTVTALDQYNNTATSYRGTVKFTSTDTNTSVVLPANYAFTSGDNGVHTFTNGVTLVAAGSQTVTATDTVTSSIKGTSNGIVVSAGAATLLSVSAPGSATAGTAFSVTVTALDQYNNTAPSYRGTVKFTSTDTNASVVLPANYAFISGDNGVHTFTSGVKLVTSGNQTVTATDTVTSSIKGTSNGIAVSAAAATLLSVSAPGSATAGTAFSVTVTALDQFNNTAASYRGTVKFTSTDTNASVVLPANYAFISGDNGVHTFTNGATLVTVGSQTVTATDTVGSSIKGTSNGIVVSAGAATLLSVSAPASATAGAAFNVTVTALDQYNNTATSYRGTVKFTSTDTNASVVLPANYAFTSGDNGVHVFSNGVTLVTAGSQTVTATDTVTSSIKGTSSGITVGAAAPHLSVSAPGSATAGTAFTLTVTAMDQFNNTATSYRGTVSFTGTDTNTSVVLPANYTFTSGDNGAHTFTSGVTLVTSGSQTVTATDTVTSSNKGTSGGITVSAAAATHLSVSAPVSATAGTAFNVTVTALDQFNNTATGYRGAVKFTSTDTNASVVLPANYAFTSGDNGVHVFNNGVTLVTAGSQTVTATDTVTSSIKGTSSGITVGAGAPHLSVSAPGSATAGTAFSVTVTALDQFNNTATTYRGTVNFTSTDTNTSVVLPANYTFTSGDNGAHIFTNSVTLATSGSQTVTATDTSSSSNKGTSNGITVSAGAATQLSVSAPGSATAGTAFSVTVTALDQYNNTATGYRGTVKFTSTDTNASVVLPANYSFTSGDNGVHAFSSGVTLATVGSQTVTATDTSTSSIKGTSSGITVGAGAPRLSVSAPGSAAVGTAFSVTVTALDQFNNTATSYRGTVSFTSTDTNASVVLPTNYTFTSGDNGVHTFSSGVKLVTAGNQTVTATDTVSSSIKGTSNGIAVSAGPVSQFSVSAPGSATTGIAFSVTVTALDQYSNAVASYRGTVKFTSTDASSFAIVPGNYTFTSGDNGVHTFTNGVTLVTVGSQTVTATDTSSSSIKGTSSGITVNPPGYTVQVISVPNGLTGTQMYGINDSGQVAEWGTESGSTLPQTFIATPSGTVPIPLPSNSGANGYAINKWGEIAGIFYPSVQGYIGSASGITLIPLPAGSSSVSATAVNDSSQIAGSVPSSGLSYIGSAAGSATLPLPGGWTSTSAYAINNPGEIAGSLTNGSNSAPFIGSPGNITVVPVTAFWMNPHGNLTAYAINDSGHIAGFGINSNSAAQAFIGTAAGIAPIPLPAGATQAMVNTQCLNNNGSVVGQSNLGGWIWDATNGTRLLNGMAPSGWSITNAISISNGGLILAQGSFNGGVSQYVELIPSGYMTVSYTELNFGLGGGVSTDPQSVTVSFEGKPLSWTVSSNQSNVTVSPASGAGTRTFQVTASAGSAATITVTAPGAVNSLQSIAVTVASVSPAAPFGSFDSPSTTGNPIYSGPLGVTGWALDSIEVTGVGIWRAPVTGETPTSNGLVFIGNAAFLAGARPDVLGDYPTTPLNYRAGWGYLMLTNGLPNSGGSGAPGNGTYVLHAIATDKAGLQTDLGTKTITVDNADSKLPFGTIDTPELGQTVSGLVTNFGWAVTPSITGCPPADQPCIIPTDGSTIVVYVDGIPTAHPLYNIDRCDVSQSYPNPPYANSGSPNCANNGKSPGPLGYYYLDTTTLSNGVHTIAWSVTDNAGRVSGIGSRYFTVAN